MSRKAAQRSAHQAAAYWAAQAELEAENRAWNEEQRAHENTSRPTAYDAGAATSSTESRRVTTSSEREAEAMREWRTAYELETRHAKLCASRRAMEEETERLAEQAVREQVALELEEEQYQQEAAARQRLEISQQRHAAYVAKLEAEEAERAAAQAEQQKLQEERQQQAARRRKANAERARAEQELFEQRQEEKLAAAASHEQRRMEAMRHEFKEAMRLNHFLPPEECNE
eukprot:5149007-Prymnesium_polylepis.1